MISLDTASPPNPDAQMFSAIKDYQRAKGLKVDGVMKTNGETQERMRKESEIETEKLDPPVENIPGTNIPDEGVPEQGWPQSQIQYNLDEWRIKMDPTMEKIPPFVDPLILLPEDTVFKKKKPRT